MFFITDVTYIGLVFPPEGIYMEHKKVKAIQQWPGPKNLKQLQSFLGFANFYHCFKDEPGVWEAVQKEVFYLIKFAISKEPLLAHPDECQPYPLETGTSGVAMGAVLLQRKDDGCLHPVAFMSASFSAAELNYDTHDQELLAIMNLEYWKSARTFKRCHAHWHLVLAFYNFVIAYWPEKEFQKPDALSSCMDYSETEPSPQIMLQETQFEGSGVEITTSILEQIKEALQDDPSLDTVMAAAAYPDSLLHPIVTKFKGYVLQDSLLLYQGRFVVPDEPEIKQQLLSHFHDSPGSGNQGRAHKFELISCQ
ncbi:Retrotransposable element Tf2 155 kDa protein type 1 [Rhizoctonia solani AG-1 IB]|uniref:Retrotransposable element Tf2 155 kDa protein type 1 n=1 Tax=Thanatephorus cucumeris (strain AG1-IB / isolate 7/3/14) TaxID=1108050 RepID=M5C3U1_THACB|nr:Retrotransposable element Tf2 155 kDa protein type 1 [Rhizoctonia solani AG-1 IB]